MPIVPVESPTMQTSRPTVLSGPTLLLSRTPLRGTKQRQLEPVLSPCERDHELVKKGVVDQEIIEGQCVGPEGCGEQILQHVEANKQEKVDSKRHC